MTSRDRAAPQTAGARNYHYSKGEPLGSGIVWRVCAVCNYSECNKFCKYLVMSGNSKEMKCENDAVKQTRLECRRLHVQRKNVYEDHLRQIDEEVGSYGTEVKMDVMYSMF